MVRAVMERLVFFHYDNGSRAGSVIETLAKVYKHLLRYKTLAAVWDAGKLLAVFTIEALAVKYTRRIHPKNRSAVAQNVLLEYSLLFGSQDKERREDNELIA